MYMIHINTGMPIFKRFLRHIRILGHLTMLHVHVLLKGLSESKWIQLCEGFLTPQVLGKQQ